MLIGINNSLETMPEGWLAVHTQKKLVQPYATTCQGDSRTQAVMALPYSLYSRHFILPS